MYNVVNWALSILVWIPETNPMELASDVLEGAQNLRNNIATHVCSLFAGDEGMTATKHLKLIDILTYVSYL